MHKSAFRHCYSADQPCNCSCCVFGQGLEEVSRTDIGKKIKEGMEEAAKTAKTSAENVSKGGERLGKTGAFKAITQVQSFYFLLRCLLNVLLLKMYVICGPSPFIKSPHTRRNHHRRLLLSTLFSKHFSNSSWFLSTAAPVTPVASYY